MWQGAEDRATPGEGTAPSFLAAFLLLVAGAGLYTLSRTLETSTGEVALGAVAISLFGVGIVGFALRVRAHARAEGDVAAFQRFFAAAPDPAVLTDWTGRVRSVNRAFAPVPDGMSLTALLGSRAPVGVAQVHRLARLAVAQGAAYEALGPASGTLLVQSAGQGALIWRLAPAPAPGPESGPDYAAARFLHLTLDAGGAVTGANPAACALIGQTPREIGEIIDDLPLRSGGLHGLKGSQGSLARAVLVPAALGAELFLFPADPTEANVVNPDRFLDHLPVALVRLTTAGRLVYVNRAARALLGDAAVPGTLLSALVEGMGRSIPDRLSDVSRGRSIGRSEIARSTGAERELFLQISFNRLVMDGDVSVIAVISDATEMKTLEAQFVQSQKMQAVGQLAGGVAHDFNNLLTAINGHCDLLLLRHEAGDGDHGDLLQIRQNANRAAALVRQLLAFSRKQTLRPKVLMLGETLGELTHLLNRLLGERVTLTIEHGAELAPVKVDERQFEQVIMNLVVNARDAMPHGGEVRIRTRNLRLHHDVERDRATIPAGDYVLVEVSDTGVGIPEDKLDKIFEPFYTTKKLGEGTGLGLSTAYGIVKQTGGFIFAASVLGQGATFSIYLPRHDQDIEIDRAPEPVDEPVRDLTGNGVVLLVEDEAPVRSFAARALRLRGYTVLEAASGEEALEITADPARKIDLLVSDVVMPGIDGPTWVRQARLSRPDIRVIFVSGYAEDVFKSDGTFMRDAVFVPKPFSLNELTQKVKEVIELERV